MRGEVQAGGRGLGTPDRALLQARRLGVGMEMALSLDGRRSMGRGMDESDGGVASGRLTVSRVRSGVVTLEVVPSNVNTTV